MNPNWKPLEEKLGPNRCVGFMYMGHVNGVHLYKHGITRTYLYLDDRGSCYVWNQPSGFVNADFATELAKLEADLRGCGALPTMIITSPGRKTSCKAWGCRPSESKLNPRTGS